MNMRVLISSLVAAMCLICSNAIACEDSEVAHPHSGQSGELDSGAVVDLEIEMIKARVLRQCGLSSKLAENKLPWSCGSLITCRISRYHWPIRNSVNGTKPGMPSECRKKWSNSRPVTLNMTDLLPLRR